MEAPGPPAVRARSRRGGPSAPQRHARGADVVVKQPWNLKPSWLCWIFALCPTPLCKPFQGNWKGVEEMSTGGHFGLQADIGDGSYSYPGEVVQCCKTTTQHCREAEDLCSSFNLDVAEDSVITCNQVISLSFKT